MNKLIPIGALLAISLAACSSNPFVHSKEGEEKKHDIDCSGPETDWSRCHTMALGQCGTRGYEILQFRGEKNVVLTQEQAGVLGGASQEKHIVFMCR